MAIGGLGGLGGLPYPSRTSRPDSQWVKSDREWDAGWGSAIGEIPQYNYASLTPGTEGFSPTVAAQYGGHIDSVMRENAGGATAGSPLEAAMLEAAKYGLTFQPGQQANGASLSFSQNPYLNTSDPNAGSHMVATGNNPAFGAINTQYEEARRQREENKVRQQQSYNVNMMGNNAENGVLPQNYSDANFGQVSGKTGGLGGLGGVNTGPQTGAYTGGSGAYNPSPFTPGNFQQSNPWSGF